MFEFFNKFLRDISFEIMIFINLNNWINYAITIEEQSALKKNKMAIPITSKHRKYLMVFLITGAIFIVIEFIAYLTGKPSFMLGIIYTLMGIGFLIYGFVIMRMLEKHFITFYFHNRCKLIIATSLLCIPITIFGVMMFAKDSFTSLNADEEQVRNASQVYFNFLIYVIGKLIPVWAQIGSLVFGFIKSKGKGKKKLNHT